MVRMQGIQKRKLMRFVSIKQGYSSDFVHIHSLLSFSFAAAVHYFHYSPNKTACQYFNEIINTFNQSCMCTSYQK